MSIRLSIAALAAAVLCAAPALAAEPDALLQALGRCTTVSSDAARLACYDGLAPRVQAENGGAPVAATAPVIAKKQQESWFGFHLGDLFGSSPSQQTKPGQFGEDEVPVAASPRKPASQEIDHITAHLSDYAYNPFGKFIVTLANGQIWKELEADDARAIFHHDPSANEVTIERGLLGSYNLYVNGGNRVFKVKRVR